MFVFRSEGGEQSFDMKDILAHEADSFLAPVESGLLRLIKSGKVIDLADVGKSILFTRLYGLRCNVGKDEQYFGLFLS